MRNIEFENKNLRIDGQDFELDYQIKDARIIDNLAVVIFKFDETAPKYRQFNNCCAFDNNGNLIWTAEHPTTTTADFYVEFMDTKSNKLWNFGCFVCILDFKTGRLKKADFTK
jgi:hypothetical protein